MSEFKSYHPLVNMVYFFAVISFSMIFMHPICLGLSFILGLVYAIYLNGKKIVKFNLQYILPLMIGSALINFGYSHEGNTILGYLPSGNPLTLESIAYGFAAAVMMAAVIEHFSCFNEIMTSDKLMYLLGKIIPSLSLVFSMILRFVPKFKVKLKAISNAQKGIEPQDVNQEGVNNNIVKRIQKAIRILSIMITWSLENAIETADSMKSRGYGVSKRTAFSNFKFTPRDAVAMGIMLILILYIFIGSIKGGFKFRYFPTLKGLEMSAYNKSLFVAYLLLYISPMGIEIGEAWRWKNLKSKI